MSASGQNRKWRPAVSMSASPQQQTSRTGNPMSEKCPEGDSCGAQNSSSIQFRLLHGRSFWHGSARFRAVGARECVVSIQLPQFCLQEFSGRTVRKIIDEQHVIRHPPFGDLAFVKGQQVAGSKL